MGDQHQDTEHASRRSDDSPKESVQRGQRDGAPRHREGGDGATGSAARRVHERPPLEAQRTNDGPRTPSKPDAPPPERPSAHTPAGVMSDASQKVADAVARRFDDAAKTITVAKEKVEQIDRQASQDERYSTLKQIVAGALTPNPHSPVGQVVGAERDIIDTARNANDIIFGSPAQAAAARERVAEQAKGIYESTYPVGYEAGRAFADEKAKGADNRAAALSAIEQGIKHAPFAAAEGHFERAYAASKSGDTAAAQKEALAGMQSFGNDVMKISTAIEGARSLAEPGSPRGSTTREAVKTSETPSLESPAAKSVRAPEGVRVVSPSAESVRGPGAARPSAGAVARPESEAGRTRDLGRTQPDMGKTQPEIGRAREGIDRTQQDLGKTQIDARHNQPADTRPGLGPQTPVDRTPDTEGKGPADRLPPGQQELNAKRQDLEQRLNDLQQRQAAAEDRIAREGGNVKTDPEARALRAENNKLIAEGRQLDRQQRDLWAQHKPNANAAAPPAAAHDASGRGAAKQSPGDHTGGSSPDAGRARGAGTRTEPDLGKTLPGEGTRAPVPTRPGLGEASSSQAEPAHRGDTPEKPVPGITAPRGDSRGSDSHHQDPSDGRAEHGGSAGIGPARPGDSPVYEARLARPDDKPAIERQQMQPENRLESPEHDAAARKHGGPHGPDRPRLA